MAGTVIPGTSGQGVMPLFVSAPRCKLVLNGYTLAYAIGMNCSVRVDVQNVFTMGQYGSLTTEPLMYGLVSGTIQIVKLNSAQELNNRIGVLNTNPTLSPFQNTTATAALAGANASLSAITPSPGVDNYGNPASVTSSNSNSALAIPNLSYHLNPAYVLASETFDLVINIAHIDPSNSSKPNSVSRLFTVQNCRFTGSNINIALGSLVNEPLTFQGLLAMDEAGNQNSDISVVDGTGQ